MERVPGWAKILITALSTAAGVLFWVFSAGVRFGADWSEYRQLQTDVKQLSTQLGHLSRELSPIARFTERTGVLLTEYDRRIGRLEHDAHRHATPNAKLTSGGGVDGS